MKAVRKLAREIVIFALVGMFVSSIVGFVLERRRILDERYIPYPWAVVTTTPIQLDDILARDKASNEAVKKARDAFYNSNDEIDLNARLESIDIGDDTKSALVTAKNPRAKRVVMLNSDGEIGDVPEVRVADALKAVPNPSRAVA